jgi:cellulose synthase/poly-beta-1,6-N-acetylglucosamine synthase-like glycosyltransferase
VAENMSARGWAVGVVVPACNEELAITACIDAIFTALHASSEVESCWVVVVADSCRDQTVELARARLGDRGEVVQCSASSPGVARRLGADRVLKRFRARASTDIWIANTDADSQPHADWITQQLALANQEYCGVAGIVHVAFIDGQRPELIDLWRADYPLHVDGTHPHVHGANLGIRADAYLDAGGWSNLALAEDHCLWARVRACGWLVVSSIASVVTTSGRLNGRATGGFADTLRQKMGLACA